MKKAAILTINDYNNYGNRLQNYAVQETLKKFGFEVETILHHLDGKSLNKKSIFNKIKSFLYSDQMYSKLKSKVVSKSQNNFLLQERIERFKKFTKKNISETSFAISEHQIPNGLSERYDYFFTGSDQVWNPNFRFGSAIDFLTFAPKEKRIAFSASFGVSSISNEYKEKYRQYLSELHGISVREHQGTQLVKELSGRDGEVLIDPTLNVSKEQWLSISEPHENKPMKKFLLTYFLGSIPQQYQKFIDEYAESNHLEIVNLADSKIEKYYTADPANFIDYIYSAEAFFTDSYHGIIFSIIMETPFLIFERIDGVQKMNSRIDTLQNTLQLPREVFFNAKHVTPFVYDQIKLKQILLVEQKKVFEFLKKYTKLNR